MRLLISVLFIVQMYVMMTATALAFAIPALISRDMAHLALRFYCNWVRWTAALMLDLRSEIRGTVPQGEVIVAAKHQSFFDVILLVSVLPRPKFIMKRELLWTPFLGQYAVRIGCIAVNRGKRGAAIAKMKADVQKGTALPGQLVIYPQGTRVAPGAMLAYKLGAALLYEQLGQPCIPAATNVGLFWPKHGILRQPGLAVIEFLPPINPGLSVTDFTKQLETRIETASNALMAEAGFAP